MSGEGGNGYVVIFKAPADSSKRDKDAYSELLSREGFNVNNVSVLDFDFINIDKLLSKLKNPQNYSGIIFSSPRCVRGCQLAIEKDSVFLDKWKNLTNYAVGEATYTLAENLGLPCLGKEAGNGFALADIILKSQFEKPFLYPKGSLTNDNFKLKLKNGHVELDEVLIYETKPHPDLEKNIENLSKRIVYPTYFVFFSPSGINFTLPFIKANNFELKDVRFVAIGPSTEKGLMDNGIHVYRTVRKPSPEGVLDALKKNIVSSNVT